jgi:UDP-N-acetylglucosamine---dolichyl-phosphate N-acetylglucosaminyltransferase
MKTYIIIPAYNESKHLSGVITRTKKFSDNLVVVDDGSKDNTADVAKKEGVVVLKHIVNLGKGAAIKTGADYALQNGADVIIFMDSDGQHDPEEIPEFLKNIKGNDIVFGSRKRTKVMPFVFKFGNWFISFVSSLFFGVKLHDTQSGYRAMTADAYRKLRWTARDYSVESEMISLVGKNKLKYKEIFIKTIYSDKYKGTTIWDGMKIVFNMVWWRLTK